MAAELNPYLATRMKAITTNLWN